MSLKDRVRRFSNAWWVCLYQCTYSGWVCQQGRRVVCVASPGGIIMQQPKISPENLFYYVISLFIIQDVPIWSAIASAVWESSMVLNCRNVQLSQIESQLWRSGNPSEYRLRPKSKSSNWRQSELRLLEKNLLGFDFPPQRCNTSDVSLWLN